MRRVINPKSLSGTTRPGSDGGALVRVAREVDRPGRADAGVALLLSALGFTPWHGALRRGRSPRVS
jgi:hypothetical protein